MIEPPIGFGGGNPLQSITPTRTGPLITNSRAPATIRGRLSPSTINKFAPEAKEFELSNTAAGAQIPIVYGTKAIPGLIGPAGFQSPLKLVVGVIWCVGPIKSVKKSFINDVDVETISGVQVRHYLGRSFQGVDDELEAVHTAYTDTFRLSKPDGEMCVAYSVYTIDSGAITGTPKFQAIIEGMLVNDPADTGNGDPNQSNISLSVEFDDASPNTQADDTSTYNHTITFVGNAYVDGELQLDGTGDRVYAANHASLNPAQGDDWCLEIACTPATLDAGPDIIFTRDVVSSQYSISLARVTNQLRVRLAYSNAGYNITDTTITTPVFSIGVETIIVVECVNNVYRVMVNGDVLLTVDKSQSPTQFLTNNGTQFSIGDYAAGGFGWNGSIRCIRFTKGGFRYGGNHVVTALPFPDSDAYTAKDVFSDNTALCFADLVTNPFYGLGKTVSNLTECRAWDNSELVNSSPTVVRSRLSLAIRYARKTEEYLDLLATYGEFFWFNDGSSVYMTPDASVRFNPSGRELLKNPSFDPEDTSPETEIYWSTASPTGWSFSANLYTHIGTNTAPLYQSIQGMELGTEYVLTVEVNVFAGSFTVDIGGVQVMSVSTTGADVYTVEYTGVAGSPEPLIEVKPSSGSAILLANVSLKEKVWLETCYVQGSLSFSGGSDTETPNRVNVLYTVQDDDSPNWRQQNTYVQLPDAGTEGNPLRETSVEFEGVFRYEEANIKAQAILYRSQNKVRLSWASTDIGIVYRRGSIVRLVCTETGIDQNVLIEAVSLVSPGRYSVSGTVYAESHYPYTAVQGVGSIPVGAITLLSAGADVPSGWSIWSTADGKYIKAVPSGGSAGDTGGAASYAGFSGSTSTDGGHDGTSTVTVRDPYSAPNIPSVENDYSSLSGTKGSHSHTFSTGTIDPDYYRLDARFIQKITSASNTLPAACMVFGLDNLIIANVSRSIAYQNRVLRASASATATGGSATKTVSFTSGSTSDAHAHTSYVSYSPHNILETGIGDYFIYPVDTAGGSHTHNYALALSRNIKRYRLALYGMTDDATIDYGVIMMWAGAVTGSPEPLPADWAVCDGTNGTPDLRDHFIEVAASLNAGTSTGDNTIALSGSGTSNSHNHWDGNVYGDTKLKDTVNTHTSNVSHSHTVTGSASHQPEYYCLYFIMYIG